MKLTFFYSLILCVNFLIISCANQLPPSGGVDDKIPPKIISIYPPPNTSNFRNDNIVIQFDEYVDRRSFQEGFFISPRPKGTFDYSWSGKEVQIKFSKPLDKNRTYVVSVGNTLKDVRGGNVIESPITFAFSTGNKIDKGKISGNVLSEKFDNVKILTFLKPNTNASLNPENNQPEFITHVQTDGKYEITNLPPGEYRIFAVTDEDRNNIFDKEIDEISIPSQDYILPADSILQSVNFIFEDFEIEKQSNNILKQLTPDSSNFIYSNFSENSKGIPPNYRFYFYFRNNSLQKADIVNNFSITGLNDNKSYKLIFNWINDSLLEVFSPEKFILSSSINVTINLTNTEKKYIFTRSVGIAGINMLSKISGKVISGMENAAQVYINLYDRNNRFITFSKQVQDTSMFEFNEVPEGDYILFSFIDENENSRYDGGNHNPFIPSEKFFIYESDLSVKGGWDINNIFIEY